jgi:tetratricopeptide (TPR) repeat protein
LLKLDGSFEEARRIFIRVCAKYEEFYGPEHPSTINSLFNYAVVLKDLKEYEASVPIFERVIEARKHINGENSVEYAMSKATLASSLRELGQYDRADSLLKDAYLSAALEFGEDSVMASTILNSQGMLYKKQGKLERAKDNYERSLAIKEKFFGEDHPETIATRHNLGELYVQWG